MGLEESELVTAGYPGSMFPRLDPKVIPDIPFRSLLEKKKEKLERGKNHQSTRPNAVNRQSKSEVLLRDDKANAA